MSIISHKRKAETQIINDDEAEQAHEKEEEQDCQMVSQYSIAELPNHLVSDILSRLPIKTLFNCRRVCRAWFSLIADPHFATLHLSRSHPSLLFKPTSGELHLVDLQIAPYTCPCNAGMKLVPKINLPKNPNISVNILNSCNGLLCLCEPRTKDPIYVCNPFLGEYITLPKSPNRTICSAYSSAFGFSPMTNQYKVVRSFQRSFVNPPTRWREHGDYEAEIYTLGEGLWRSIGKTRHTIQNYSFDAFLNGALHWLPSDTFPDVIYCFDFGSEQFRGVPEPSEFGPLEKQLSHNFMQIGVLRGCLSICDFINEGHIAIWVMNDYGVKESWSKDIVFKNMICERSYANYFEAIMILQSGQVLMLINGQALFLYDPKMAQFKDVKLYGTISEFHGIAHVPSLVSLRDVAIGGNLKKHTDTSPEATYECRTRFGHGHGRAVDTCLTRFQRCRIFFFFFFSGHVSDTLWTHTGYKT